MIVFGISAPRYTRIRLTRSLLAFRLRRNSACFSSYVGSEHAKWFLISLARETEVAARTGDGRNAHCEVSRCGLPTGLIERDNELGLCCSDKVLDLVCKALKTFAKFDSVTVRFSVEHVGPLSEETHDLVGEGGRGTVEGVRLIQLIDPENVVGEIGGVKLQSMGDDSSCDILV
jgi:hypothetical protein